MAMMRENLRAFVAHVYAHSRGWRRRFDALGLSPRDFADETDLVKLPVLRKEALPDLQREDPPFGGLICGDAAQLARIFLSPGPIYDPQREGTDPWGFAPALTAAGFRRGERVINTFSYHLSPAGMMFDEALRALGCVVIPAGVGNSELQVRLVRDLAVTGYVGTPSFLGILLDRATEIGVEFPIKKAFFTAERVTEEMKARFAAAGIAFCEGYGTADAGCIAYQVPGEHGLRVADRVLVQLCDPQTGQPVGPGEAGEVVVTVFDPVYPLLRFGTGDLSRWVEGAEGKVLAGVLGRVGEAVKVRGMFVHPRQVQEVAARFPEVRGVRAVVSSDGMRDRFTLQVAVPSAAWCAELAAAIQAYACDVLRVTPEVTRVDEEVLAEGKVIVDIRDRAG